MATYYYYASSNGYSCVCAFEVIGCTRPHVSMVNFAFGWRYNVARRRTVRIFAASFFLLYAGSIPVSWCEYKPLSNQHLRVNSSDSVVGLILLDSFIRFCQFFISLVVCLVRDELPKQQQERRQFLLAASHCHTYTKSSKEPNKNKRERRENVVFVVIICTFFFLWIFVK